MVGQLTVTKPSRSDELLDTDQQLKITDEIRAHFESLVPKRPLKPNRSESDSSTPTRVDSTPIDENIPELDKFRALQSRSQVSSKHLDFLLFFFMILCNCSISRNAGRFADNIFGRWSS
ncbi:hypothetical protein F2P56_013867 [Juglans regia]|uniref:Uncharacterized protein n=1 Tax=Juglans regia TaxID=51240 RepID=A0A833XCK3_JUGRE|nr:hypothetical protein F2P56_013867 [Juglans regia]